MSPRAGKSIAALSDMRPLPPQLHSPEKGQPLDPLPLC